RVRLTGGWGGFQLGPTADRFRGLLERRGVLEPLSGSAEVIEQLDLAHEPIRVEVVQIPEAQRQGRRVRGERQADLDVEPAEHLVEIVAIDGDGLAAGARGGPPHPPAGAAPDAPPRPDAP